TQAEPQRLPRGIEDDRHIGCAGEPAQFGVTIVRGARRQRPAEHRHVGVVEPLPVLLDQRLPLGLGHRRPWFQQQRGVRVDHSDGPAGLSRDRRHRLGHTDRPELFANPFPGRATDEPARQDLVPGGVQDPGDVHALAAGAGSHRTHPGGVVFDQVVDPVRDVQRGVGRDRQDHSHRPPRATARTCNSSSRTTRSARCPAAIWPTSTIPTARAGVADAERDASTIDTPAATALRTAASMVSVLPAMDPVAAIRATPSSTRTRRPPSSYSPSPAPAADIASATSATRELPTCAKTPATTAGCRWMPSLISSTTAEEWFSAAPTTPGLR